MALGAFGAGTPLPFGSLSVHTEFKIAWELEGQQAIFKKLKEVVKMATFPQVFVPLPGKEQAYVV